MIALNRFGVVPLARAYAALATGTPVLDRVEATIFTRRSQIDCMGCTYCHDSCCQYGADIDLANVARLQDRQAEIEAFTGVPASAWLTEVLTNDAEYPTGQHTRTATVGNRCVFVFREGRGCQLHRMAMARGEDYHALKPMVCALFPVTFDGGLLRPSYELLTGELVCVGPGPTLYAGSRDELAHYFGGPLVDELDGLAAQLGEVPRGGGLEQPTR